MIKDESYLQYREAEQKYILKRYHEILKDNL